jgi:hypothetical protein
MYRLSIGLLCGALIGALLTYVLVSPRGEPPATDVIRDIVVVEKMTEAVAEEHRKDRYEALQSVEEIYALPSAFARAEALYALAGRSESGAVQNLIFEANRVADPEDRSGALNILFFRLTELDPQSALVLSRGDSLRGDRNQERRVWVSWARRDLNAAMAAAKADPSETARNFATQSMFLAFGYMGNETTALIEEEMGIEPDRSTRGRFIYRLADESPAKAIAFINQLESGTRQEEYVSWLAYYLAPRDPERALSYAVLFDSKRYQEAYESIVGSQVAIADPTVVMERLAAGDRSGLSRDEIYGAIRGIAKGDPDVAMAYYDQLQSTEEKYSLVDAIINSMANRDIDEALRWARSNETGTMPTPEMQVLRHIATRDLHRAIQEANNMADSGTRDSVLAEVIQIAAQRNPADAVKNMHLIKNPDLRDGAAQTAVHHWLRQDATEAVDWLLAQDADTANEYLGSPRSIARYNVDAAIRLLPIVDEDKQRAWRNQIAKGIATTRSAAEAMAFIRQFEGQTGYGSLQASVISGVAQSDIVTARQMADQLPNGDAKDSTYAQLIQARSATHPQEALTWIELISSEQHRGRAAASVASQWHTRDAAAAQSWADGLPAGPVRDDAIVGLVSQWRNFGPEQESLLASISNKGKRSQAMLQHMYTVARRNPVRARELLEKAELADYERERVETYLNRIEGASY